MRRTLDFEKNEDTRICSSWHWRTALDPLGEEDDKQDDPEAGGEEAEVCRGKRIL